MTAAGDPADGTVSAVETLRRRADFLRVAGGRKAVLPGLVLQARATPREAAPAGSTVRVGFTASRKVGPAVSRNRARRRLRALVREILPAEARPGFDYVVIARAATVERPFAELRVDLQTALDKVGARRSP